MSRGERRQVLEAAGVGHRITHQGDLPAARELVATVARWGAGELAKQHGDAPLLSALLGTALSELAAVIEGDEPGECPDPCGALEVGSPNTFLGPERRAAALVDEGVAVACEKDSDGPIVMGAAHVWVNGKRLARRTDELDCGARVGEGEPTVLVGAPAEGQASRVPRSAEGWIGASFGVLYSGGCFGDLGDTLGPHLGAVLGGGAPPGALEQQLREHYRRALAGAWGPEVARRVAAGDLSALLAALSG